MGDGEEGKASFWTTVPGILTGVAAVITAVGTILALVLTGGKGPGDDQTLADWARQANRVCEDTYGEIRALGIPPDSSSQFRALPQTTRISTRGNQRLQTLERPSEGADRVDELLSLASQAHVAAKDAYTTWAQGDYATAQARLAEAQRTDREVRRLDGELGANVCAQGP